MMRLHRLLSSCICVLTIPIVFCGCIGHSLHTTDVHKITANHGPDDDCMSDLEIYLTRFGRFNTEGDLETIRIVQGDSEIVIGVLGGPENYSAAYLRNGRTVDKDLSIVKIEDDD